MDGEDAAALRQRVLTAADMADSLSPATFRAPDMTHEDPLDIANECFSRFGFWPISFSSPFTDTYASLQGRRLLSEVVPGTPYSFDAESDYYAQYKGSIGALTHKKAGWDCFRHVEILGCGGVPLMPDIDELPRYTMVHYPKSLLSRALHEFIRSGAVPDGETYSALQAFIGSHLTVTSMVDYAFSVANVRPRSVLFLDQALRSWPDYLSLLTLMGLTRKLGRGCHVHWVPDYLYADWEGDSHALYGRGFGYMRSLEPAERATSPVSEPHRGLPDLDAFDAVVIGSVYRNVELANEVSQASTSAERFYFFGEDHAPYRSERRWLSSLNGHAFVREIY